MRLYTSHYGLPCLSIDALQRLTKLCEVGEWLSYDLPSNVAKAAWKGRFRGQTQKWYAVRFTGNEGEINILNPAGGHKPEFVEWRWEPMRNLPALIIPFKRKVYERVVKEFAHLAKHAVMVERGPMERFGAKGSGTSVYFRDPDGSLMEFISYMDRSK